MIRRIQLPPLWLATIVFLPLLAGCSDTAIPSSSPPVPLPDKSLQPQEYLAAGVPATDRPWTSTDLANAAKALTALANEDLAKLPRFESPRSGAVFAKLTTVEILDQSKSESLPLEIRLGESSTVLQALHQLLKLYSAPHASAPHARVAITGPENIEILGAHLRTIVVIAEQVEELEPQLDKNAPDYATRQEGLARMQKGAGMLIMGGVMMLSEHNTYAIADLTRLTSYLLESMPGLYSLLTAETRIELQSRLRSYREDPKMQPLQPELDSLIERVKALNQWVRD